VHVLLSDGSGLTARQCATQLAAGGHTVDVLSSDRFALTRFTRHVRRVHTVPPYGLDPCAWLDAALDVWAAGAFDVLLPTQEQVAVLSCCPERLDRAGVATVVPAFESLARVQDKLSAHATLGALGLPQPEATVISTGPALAGWDRLPIFLKTPIGTATTGVRRVVTTAALASLADDYEAAGVFSDGGVLVQAPVAGPLVMAQSVFDHGRLVASHANLRVREGVRGGASQKRSIESDQIRKDLATLGAALAWHGALSADAILTPSGPRYIDVNPRLVEPGNAWRAGVDLVSPLLDLATNTAPRTQAPGRPEVVTHQLVLAMLGAAQHEGTRRAITREIVAGVLHRASYRASPEELTPLRGDLRAAVPVVIAAAATLARPPTWRIFASGAVVNYALTASAWRRIVVCHSEGMH
jgi:biotin carboxylase